MKIFKSKKGFQLKDLSNIGISLMIVAITLSIGATIVSNIATTNQPSGFNVSNPGTWDVAYNATTSGLTGVNTLASYIPTVALVAVAAVVVGIVLMFFGKSNN